MITKRKKYSRKFNRSESLDKKLMIALKLMTQNMANMFYVVATTRHKKLMRISHDLESLLLQHNTISQQQKHIYGVVLTCLSKVGASRVKPVYKFTNCSLRLLGLPVGGVSGRKTLTLNRPGGRFCPPPGFS